MGHSILIVNKYLKVTLWSLSTILLIFAVFNFSEAFNAKLNPSSYYFGSESMVAHGGEKYQNLETYFNYHMKMGLFSTGLAILLYLISKKKSSK